MSKWSQKLDAYLAVKKISKRQLSSELGISINTMQKWWGRREPSPEHASKIQQLLNENISTTVTMPDNNAPLPVTETDSDEVAAGELIGESLKQGERYEDRSVVVSLLRTICPFCGQAVDRFRNCSYCGQHFVWANVPMDKLL